MSTVVEERWSTVQACKATGTTERMLGYWRRNGWLTFAQEDRGPGYPITWSFTDLLRIMCLKEAMRGASGRPARLAPLLAAVPLDGDLLLIEPHVAACTAEQVAALATAYPFVTVFPLAAIRDALAYRIRRLAS